VTTLGASAASGLALPHAIAAAVLLLGVAVMVLGPAPAATSALEPGDRS
jgi:mannitol/fructose-specific phosphotransferase system IIA component (Ntr-type)